MKPMKIDLQSYSSDSEFDSQNQNALGAKIAGLKQNAFTLLQEIKQLGSLSFIDICQGINLYDEVRRFEIKLILRALEETDGNQVRAARLLCMKVTTLNAKLKRYGIDPHDSIGEVVSLSGIKEQYAYTAKSSNAD